MTSAALPHTPTASQLSENIGDVLASIRRMIAQDVPSSPPSFPDAAVLRLDPGQAVAAEGESLDRAAALRRAVSGRSAALLAQADESPDLRHFTPDGPVQTLIARHEDARVIGGAEDRVVTGQPDWASGPLASPPHLTTSIRTDDAGITAESAVADRPETPQSSVAPAASCLSDEISPSEDRPTEGAAAGPVAEAMPADEGPTADAAVTLPAAEAPETVLVARVALTAADAAPCILAPTPQPEPLMTEPAELPALQAGTEIEGSILGVMIRELVRQELQTGSMSRDLRAMVLREVAGAITGRDVANPVLG